MQILRLRWRNFCSYGNNWNELNLMNNASAFYNIVGGNAQGKSSLIAALQFALYGKVANRKLKALPNRLNKHAEVYVEIISNNKLIKISRGLEPNYFTVDIDGVENFGDTAGKLNIQDKLEDEFYNIPYYVFNNIVSLSISDFKSFLKMNPSDKRMIIDKIFGLAIINKMYDLLKTDIKSISEEDAQLSIQSNLLTRQIDKTMKQLEDLSQKIQESSEIQRDEILEKMKVLIELRDKMKESLTEQATLYKEFSSSISETKHLISESKFKISDINKKLELYHNDKCPVCQSDLQTEFHKEVSDTYSRELRRWDKKQEELAELLERQISEKEAISKHREKLDSKLSKINMNHAVLDDQLVKLSDIRVIDEQTVSLKSLITDSEEQLHTTKKERVKVENKLKFYKIVEEALNDKGIKQLAVKTILPTINSQIHSLMKELNLEYKLIFTEDWSTNISHLGYEVDPATLSMGENKKLDIAVILAIIKLLKLKFPGLNILFLDEVMSSLDPDSTAHVLKLLSHISKEQALHIFLINHSQLDESVFDYSIFVEKLNGFSNIRLEQRI